MNGVFILRNDLTLYAGGSVNFPEWVSTSNRSFAVEFRDEESAQLTMEELLERWKPSYKLAVVKF